MPTASIRSLIDRQLKLWTEDPQVRAAQIYLSNPAHSAEFELTEVGDGPTIDPETLEEICRRAADNDELPGFEANLAGHRGYVYPVLNASLLQGFCLLFPSGPQVDWAKWKRDANGFSSELLALGKASAHEPPTFGSLIEAFPDEPESRNPSAASPHWEKSRSRAEKTLDDDLSRSLIVDHLPIF